MVGKLWYHVSESNHLKVCVIYMRFYTFIFLCILLLGTKTSLALASFTQSFTQWQQDFAIQAKKQGITEQTLQTAFYPFLPQPAIIKLDRNQAEFKKTFGMYVKGAVTYRRIQRAKVKYQEYLPILHEIYDIYGVQPQYLVALWGLETNFGGYLGKQPVLQSLVTLAYDTRRRKFFEQELLYALQIVQEGHIDVTIKGSWAGAFGNMQFMPSTFVNYAVDGDGDGKIDLFNNPKDFFHSAGNFLSKIGWEKTEIWGEEVQLPQDIKNFDWQLVGHDTQKSLADWQQLGIMYVDGTPLNTYYEHQASLLIPQGYTGPKFLVYNNFRRILNWNRSDSYAFAIGLLANAIMNYPPMTWTPSAHDKGIDMAHIEIVQKYLQQQGLYTGEIDRIIGDNTIKGIRIWQAQNNMIADGYITQKMVQIMQQELDK